ncbi:MAG: hypothetical protein ACLVJH_10215 [Faecalibacterium prausnitzii]
MKEYAFGIDLGGTTAKVACSPPRALCWKSGKSPPTPPTPVNTSSRNLADAIHAKMAEKEITSEQVEGVRHRRPRPRAGQPRRPHHLRQPWRLGRAERLGSSCPACWTA